MAEALLLGIDVGTGSSKGILTTPDGRVVMTTAREHDVSYPRPGFAEQDAEGVWWRDVAAIARELSADSREIAAICVSGIGPCVLPADIEGRPLRPAILYGIDSRATREIELLDEQLGRDEILRRGGSALSSQAVGPKLLWLRRAEPAVWAETRRFFMPSSYAVFRLTGAYALDHHSASQCDPLYDMGRRGWAHDWADVIAPGLELPELAWSHEIVGRIHERGAAETGLTAGTPVCAGTIDAWSEAHSAGVREPGDFMLMYGSTIFMLQVGDAPLGDPRLWTTVGCLPRSITYAGGLATSGALTGWLREIAGGIGYDQLEAEAAVVQPGSDGLVMLPYFAGERTPIYDPDARGVIAGLTLRHGRGHLYRAILEASAYAVRHSLEVFDEIAGTSRRIVAVGGGTTGSLWTQIVSDVTGVDQELPGVTIGASYGDALLAAQGLGLVAASETWARIARVARANPGIRLRYDESYATYRELQNATTGVQHRIAAANQD